MKNIIFIFSLIFYCTVNCANAQINEEEFAYLISVRNQLLTNENPHAYDAEMGNLTAAAERAFKEIIPIETMTYEDARASLISIAKTMDGRPTYYETWENLLNTRITNELVPEAVRPLLPMALSLFAEEEIKQFVLGHDPINESPSAVYNVWFYYLMGELVQLRG